MYILIISGILLFIVTAGRFIYMLHKGEYRLGSRKDFLRMKFEKKQLMGPMIVSGVGLSLILNNVNVSFMTLNANTLTLLIAGPLVFYLCIFSFPEQLMLLYCKFRFESFNYDLDGKLMPSPFEEDDERDREF